MKQYDLLNKTASAGVDWDLRFQILFLIQTTIVLHLVSLLNIFLKRDWWSNVTNYDYFGK